MGRPPTTITTTTPILEQAAPERPMIFAIMRNGHEVLRGSMLDIEAALKKNDMVTAKAMWKKLQRWDNLHMRMEEGRKKTRRTRRTL
jgi:hypothetical protein